MVKRTFVKSIFPTVKNKNNCYAQTLKRYRKKNNSKNSNFLGLTITTNICSFFSYTLALATLSRQFLVESVLSWLRTASKTENNNKKLRQSSKSSKQRSNCNDQSENLKKKIVKSLCAKTSSSHRLNPRDNASSRCDKVIFCVRPFYISKLNVLYVSNADAK